MIVIRCTAAASGPSQGRSVRSVLTKVQWPDYVRRVSPIGICSANFLLVEPAAARAIAVNGDHGAVGRCGGHLLRGENPRGNRAAQAVA